MHLPVRYIYSHLQYNLVICQSDKPYLFKRVDHMLCKAYVSGNTFLAIQILTPHAYRFGQG